MFILVRPINCSLPTQYNIDPLMFISVCSTNYSITRLNQDDRHLLGSMCAKYESLLNVGRFRRARDETSKGHFRTIGQTEVSLMHIVDDVGTFQHYDECFGNEEDRAVAHIFLYPATSILGHPQRTADNGHVCAVQLSRLVHHIGVEHAAWQAVNIGQCIYRIGHRGGIRIKFSHQFGYALAFGQQNGPSPTLFQHLRKGCHRVGKGKSMRFERLQIGTVVLHLCILANSR